MVVKEVIRGDHKIVVKLGVKLPSGEQLYDLEHFEYFNSLKEWRPLSIERNYSKGALNLIGIMI